MFFDNYNHGVSGFEYQIRWSNSVVVAFSLEEKLLIYTAVSCECDMYFNIFYNYPHD